MKNLILAAALVLLSARVGQAQPYEFKAYSFANFGSPFYYVPTTAEELESAVKGGAIGGNWGETKLDELFQIGQTSWTDEYDVGGGLHVKFSAEAVHHPPRHLSFAAPRIGAKAFASNNQYIGPSTVIGESYVYLKDKLAVRNFTGRDQLLKSFNVTFALDGFADVSGDAIVQVGMACLLTADVTSMVDHPLTYSGAEIKTLQQSGATETYNFGQPVLFSAPPISLTTVGPYGTEVIDHGIHELTVESLLYVRAQTGISVARGPGTANVDFSNTMQVANIQFFDENDQVIPGLQVVGANGDVYPYNVVPEPRALALVGAGSIGLLLARSRRTKQF
jgi:hypothetical protein